MESEWEIIIAAGPSLTRRDCDALRGIGHTTAVNCAVFAAPWAHCLFAADGVWWRHYGWMVNWYKGHRVAKTFRAPTVEKWTGKGWARTGGNSGHMAMLYRVDAGARNLALLGFDQQVPVEGKNAGKVHYHGDHPKKARDGSRTNMGNGTGIKAWPRLMDATANDLKRRGVRVVNLSRETALTCFPRMTVKEFLEMVKNGEEPVADDVEVATQPTRHKQRAPVNRGARALLGDKL